MNYCYFPSASSSPKSRCCRNNGELGAHSFRLSLMLTLPLKDRSRITGCPNWMTNNLQDLQFLCVDDAFVSFRTKADVQSCLLPTSTRASVYFRPNREESHIL